MRDTPPGQPRRPPPPWRQIALHAVAAGSFFFTLNYLAMRSNLTTSLMWAAVGTVGAGWLAWSQYKRGG